MIQRALPFLFAVNVGAVVLGFILTARIQKMLRERHPLIYAAMGSPTLIMNNTISNNIAFTKFLLKREYCRIDDESLFKLCNSTYWFFCGYLVYFAVTVGLFFFAIGRAT